MTVAERPNYTPTELMACVAARLLEDGKSVFVGTGLPMIAAMLAQRTYAPNLLVIFEAGGIGRQVPVLPISVGDSRTFHRAVAASSMHDVMSFLQNGYIDYGFLGAAAIDPYGNINTTVIGDYDNPRARLPGSGGANAIGSLCRKVLIIALHDRRRLAERVDFITTPGYIDGPGSREKWGLPPDTGPAVIITNKAVLRFDEETKEAYLESFHPDCTVEEVVENTPWDLAVSPEVRPTEPPTPEELRVIREGLDPARMIKIYLNRGYT